jgi:hypothetical protein
LLARAIKELGPGFIEYIGVDALYVDKQWINQCLDADIQPVLRTKEGRLDIVKDAEGLFSALAEKGDEIERIEGIDSDRGMKYKFWGANGFSILA